jgi:hypothetical protein
MMERLFAAFISGLTPTKRLHSKRLSGALPATTIFKNRPSTTLHIRDQGPRAAINDHVSLFVASISTDRIVSQYARSTQADTDNASWQAGIWSDAYWPTNASQIRKNGREVLAPLTGSIRLASNDTNYSVQDFKKLCNALTDAMQSAFSDRAVRSFYYNGDKPD